jgi:hypothetical protein
LGIVSFLSRIPRPSPALIVAIVAVVIATTGFAVAKIPGKGGVIHACYEKESGALRVVNHKKCPRGSKALAWNQKGRKGSKGSRGAAGAKGDTGNTGASGTATAFARVAANGTLEPGDSGRQNKNVIAANVEHDVTTGTGHYCFGGLPFGVASAVVSPDSAGDINGRIITSVAIQRGVTLGNCDADHQQARVTTFDEGAAALADHRFTIWFESTGGPQIAPGPGGD